MSTFRKYADTMGMLAMPSDEEDAWHYGKAVERFGVDRDRAAFMRVLLSLGIAPERIRWH